MAKVFWKLRLEFFAEDEQNPEQVHPRDFSFEELSELDQEHILECVKEEFYSGVLFSSLIRNE